MSLYRFQKIRRTSRLKSTAGTGAANQGKERRERALINANEKAKQSDHQSAKIEARFARRNHSSSSAWLLASAASRLAMSTIQKSCRRSYWCVRTISRRRRRTRLRKTALPTCRLVINPTREAPEFWTARTLITMNLPRSARPSRFTRLKSAVRVRRRVLGKENARAPGMSIVDLTTAIELQLCRAFFRTAKVFPRNVSGEDSASKSKTRLRRRRSSRRLVGACRTCRGRCFSRTRCGCCFGRTRCGGCFRSRCGWACSRGLGSFGFLLARREKRSTGQYADIFFHNGVWKGHIALID